MNIEPPASSPARPDAAAIAAMLGADLAHYASRVPTAMARELLAGDQSWLSPFQIGEPLLRCLTDEMRDWETVDVLRAIYPATALSRTRMQPIAGSVAAITCRAHPSLCYYPYIPVSVMAERRRTAPLIVAVHGSSRNAKDLRDELAAFAEERGCFVLAPLFPLDLDRAVPDEEYKQLTGEILRYDLAFWAMVEELSQATGVSFERIFLFGFSGGAQFAQRLPFVCAERLAGVVMGAPTYVTLPEPEVSWPTGLKGFPEHFGRSPALQAMRSLPQAVLCGTADNAPIRTYSREELGLDAEAFAAFGGNRIERMEALRRAYGRSGLPIACHRVEGAAHAWLPIIRAAKPILGAWVDETMLQPALADGFTL